MTAHITIVGTAGADPMLRTTQSGRQVTELRLAVTERKRDAEGIWGDGVTSWYRVSAWGSLAVHAAASFHKGDQVIVHGKVRIVEWASGDKQGRNVEITADALGHNLQFGTSSFVRARRLGSEHDDAAAHTEHESQRELVDTQGWAMPTDAPDETPF